VKALFIFIFMMILPYNLGYMTIVAVVAAGLTIAAAMLRHSPI
jgi:hypothetical protein